MAAQGRRLCSSSSKGEGGGGSGFKYHYGRFKEWSTSPKYQRFGRVARVLRVAVLSFTLYELGYQRGIIAYATDPVKKDEELVHRVLEDKSKVEGYLYSPKSAVYKRIDTIAQKLLDSARKHCNKEIKDINRAIADIDELDNKSQRPKVDSVLKVGEPDIHADAVVRNERRKAKKQLQGKLVEWTVARQKLHGDWKLVLSTDSTPNAFVSGECPRRIFVHEGLLTQFDLSDDEVALILGHELSHVILGHTDENMIAFASFLVGLEMVILTLFDPIGLSTVLLDYTVNKLRVFVEAGYSRLHEHEADALGLELAHESCFNVIDGAKVFEKLNMLETENHSHTNKWEATHPSSADRYVRLKKLGHNHPNAAKQAEICAAIRNDWVKASKSVILDKLWARK